MSIVRAQVHACVEAVETPDCPCPDGCGTFFDVYREDERIETAERGGNSGSCEMTAWMPAGPKDW